MKKSMITKIIIGFMVLLGAGNVFAADATVGLDINSAYIWRGITFNDGFVFQPSIDVTKGGFGLNVWGNIDGEDYDDSLETGEFSEVDITVSYAFDFEPVSISIGYIEYLFPTTEKGGGEGTRELFVSLGMDIIGSLSGGLDIYYDIDELEEFYLNLSLAYSVTLNDKTSMDLGAGIGYAGDEYCADGDSGIYDYLLSAGLNYAVSDSLSIGAALNYADSADEDNLPEQDADFFGGESIAYGF